MGRHGRGRGRGRGFRRGPRGGFWLLPLVIGIAIGGLLFGGLRGPWRYEDQRWGRSGPGYRQPEAPAAPPAAAAPAAPRAEDQQAAPRDRGHWRGGRELGPRRDHGPFFPFAGLRLIVPLLLIGAGVWLLSGRRGPGNWGGPAGPQSHQGPPYTPPQAPYTPPQAPPASPHPGAPPEPPATGETRML